MSYYYVKSGGTATGDAGRYATKQTGSFASLGAAGYYDSEEDVQLATTPPVDGDFILKSDLSTDAAGTTSVLEGGTSGSPIYFISVDDANIDSARTSGNRAQREYLDLTLRNDLHISGFNIEVNDDLNTFVGRITIEDSVVNLTGIGSTLSIVRDGDYIRLINTNLFYSSTTPSSVNIEINNAAEFEMIGGSVTTNKVDGLNTLVARGGVNGGANLIFKGVDLTEVSGTLVAGMGADLNGDDQLNIRFDLCKLAAGVTFVSETFKSYNQRALFTRCSNSSAAAEYQYHLHAFGGNVEDDSTVFRNEDPAFEDSNQKISYKVVTNTDASLGSPLWFEFPNKRWAALSAGASDTIRIYLTSNDLLTDKDVYIEIIYPDGANKQTPNFITSGVVTVGGSRDLLSAGTTLTADATSTWTGGLTNKYQIDIDTSSNVGADTVPIVRVFVTKPSSTIHISSIYELS